jgi:hypothetical protein
MATCFEQLHAHPYAARANKTKVTIANLILGPYLISVLLFHSAY